MSLSNDVPSLGGHIGFTGNHDNLIVGVIVCESDIRDDLVRQLYLQSNVSEVVIAGGEKVSYMRFSRSDVIIISLVLCTHERLRSVLSVSPNVRLIALAEYDECVGRADVAVEISGIIVKDTLHHTSDVIECVLAGYVILPKILSGQDSFTRLRIEAFKSLAKEEFEALQYISQGMTNKEIAEELKITQNRVNVHVRNLLRKLYLANRTRAAIFYILNRSEIDG